MLVCCMNGNESSASLGMAGDGLCWRAALSTLVLCSTYCVRYCNLARQYFVHVDEGGKEMRNGQG